MKSLVTVTLSLFIIPALCMIMWAQAIASHAQPLDSLKHEVVVNVTPINPQLAIIYMVKPVYPIEGVRAVVTSRVVVLVTRHKGIINYKIISHKVGAREFGFDREALTAVAQWQLKGDGALEAEFRFR